MRDEPEADPIVAMSGDARDRLRFLYAVGVAALRHLVDGPSGLVLGGRAP
jgi:hypothetical protein